MHSRVHRLDVTQVTDREDLAEVFGDAATWRANINVLTTKEAKERDPQRKRMLRLLLLNAHTQLALITNEGA
jgi:hypothetical protein